MNVHLNTSKPEGEPTTYKQTTGISEPTSETSLGSLRFDSDKRQIGAILMIAGLCAVFEPLAAVATAIGPNGTTDSSGIPLSEFVGSLCLIVIGILAVFVGYNQVVYDWGNVKLTGFLMVFSVTSIIPFMTNMVEIGFDTRDSTLAIHPAYGASKSNFVFIGSMGILGVLTYSAAFVGAILSLSYTLFKFQSRCPHDRKFYPTVALHSNMLRSG